VGEDKKKKNQEIQEKLTFDEALRREKVAKARTAELELAEKEGSLISKTSVYNSLFDIGKQIRDALLSVPERVTDDIIANVSNRTKVRNLIYDAIAVELEKLSEINKKYE
jgi:phage terminase Nu1 subunit (DNA packaging protein)